MKRHAILALALLAGCASQPRPEAATSPKAAAMSGSFLEINYIRGNYMHRFIATAKSDAVLAECWRDKQLLKSRTMDASKYMELVKQANDLVDAPKVETAPTAACRTPFNLKIKRDDSVRSLEGCRSSEQGVAFGKLIKDAEFSVFSEN